MTTPSASLGISEKAKKLTPHARLILASRKRRGIRLTAEEVWYLVRDDAIEQRGLCDLGEREEDFMGPGCI